MPKVGNKEFPYSFDGKRAAALYRRKKMQTSDGYMKLRKEK